MKVITPPPIASIAGGALTLFSSRSYSDSDGLLVDPSKCLSFTLRARASTAMTRQATEGTSPIVRPGTLLRHQCSGAPRERSRVPWSECRFREVHRQTWVGKLFANKFLELTVPGNQLKCEQTPDPSSTSSGIDPQGNTKLPCKSDLPATVHLQSKLSKNRSSHSNHSP